MTAFRRELSVGLVLAGLFGVLAWVAPGFFGRAHLLALLSAAAPVLVVSCGMALVMVSRQIDISVGSQFAWCSVLVGLLARAGWPMPIAATAAVLAGAAFGALNGVFVAGLRLPSIVVTLALMVTGREALRWTREGEFVRDLPDQFQWFGLSQTSGMLLIPAVAAAVLLALGWAARRMAIGRWVYAVGSDAEAARLAGISPQRVTFGVFTLLGALTGLAAVLNAVRFTDIDPKTGTGLELQAIAAAVVGGVAVRGGRGRLRGVFLGVLLLACIGPALVFLGIPPQWEKAVQGGIILLAVATEGGGGRR